MALQRVTLDVPAGHDMAGLIFVVRSADSTVWWRDGALAYLFGTFFICSYAHTPLAVSNQAWLHLLVTELNSVTSRSLRAPTLQGA